MAAAEPTWPSSKARWYTSYEGTLVTSPGPPRVVT